MKRYDFTIYGGGYGETLEAAWEDFVEGFCQEPGKPPEEYTVEEED